MARNILGKFQTREFSVWKGMARENHLSAIYGESPQKASDLMITLMGYQRPGRTFEKLINSLPTKSFPTDDEYQWPVMGSTRENVALVEARDEAGTVIDLSYTGNVGAGTAPFKLVFPKDAFADGEDYLLADDDEEFARAVSVLLEDEKLNHRIASSAYQKVRKYYSQEMFNKIVKDVILNGK